MFLTNVKTKNFLLYVFLCSILSVQADDIYTNFVFYNKSAASILKVAPAHSRCINPDPDNHKTTTILPKGDPSSYWSDSIKTSCSKTGDVYVQWKISVFHQNNYVCSALLVFSFKVASNPAHQQRKWMASYTKERDGKSPLCESISVDNPYDISTKTLGAKNKITVTYDG